MTVKGIMYFLLFVCLALFLFMYNMIDDGSGAQKMSFEAQNRIDTLVRDLDTAKRKLEDAERKLNALEAQKSLPEDQPESFDNHPRRKTGRSTTQRVKPKAVLQPVLQCGIDESPSDVQMLETYEIIKFDNIDGGVWKQGWEITYDESKVVEEDQLEVIVVPHSHCDPGWIQTFEQYFKQQTRNILDGMARNLKAKKDMTFIYAEMSFFERWWKDQTEEVRSDVRKYAESKQFEIVTGGWVMTDEANAHFHSMITELFEGHEFIRNNLGKDATPKSHWSIDPFGLTPTLPYLMTLANVTQAAVQRVHYEVKKELASTKNLEFKWKQLFASKSEMMTHIFPFYSYDVPHTCGPNPKICCQFDFRRLPEGGKSCDWGVPPRVITEKNVAERSHMIYDQWRKKSQLYKTNTLFVPLGDDFRYDIQFEWDSQHDNYQKLFEYMNAKKEWNIKARFGTLNDYFTALKKNLKEDHLPSLTGDFFTYADRDDHYWSGYFTSRPFYKQLDGVLRNWLRSAEIMATISSIETGSIMSKEVYAKLVEARRALSLFQHHDAVTGTAKDHVVIDYGDRMLKALKNCEEIISNSLGGLLVEEKKIKVEEVRDIQDIQPEKHVYKFDESVVLINTLLTEKKDTVCILVDGVDLAVEGPSDVEIQQQISPAFTVQADDLKMREGVYELCISTTLKPLSVLTMSIIESSGKAQKVTIQSSSGFEAEGFVSSEITTDSVIIENDAIKAEFSKETGMMKSIEEKTSSKKVNVNAHFVHYGVRKLQRFTNGGTDYPSGAYLFLPDGPAKKVEIGENDFVVIDGPVSKKLIVRGNKDLKLIQKYSIDKVNNYVDIETLVDISAHHNYELALKFATGVQSQDRFFTDLNGFQNIRRKRFAKLPLQANYYPMVSGAFIEDDTARITLFSAQPLGVSSMNSGEIEVMLDRRLSTDDGRGVGQGVLDNKLTLSRFRLLLEPQSAAPSDAHYELHSAYGNEALQSFNYPTAILFSEGSLKKTQKAYSSSEVNCDIQLVNLRILTDPESGAPKKEAALILHKTKPNCKSSIDEKMKKCRSQPHKIYPKAILPKTTSARNASLTLLYDGVDSDSFNLDSHEVKTIRLTW